MLDKLNSVTEKPGVVAAALGIISFGLGFLGSKFTARDMRHNIAGEFEKQKDLMKGGQ